jgi:hypothetical protein
LPYKRIPATPSSLAIKSCNVAVTTPQRLAWQACGVIF